MQELQYQKYLCDKSRNKSSGRSVLYLWCYRTICSKSFFALKILAKICNEMFKFSGMGIETPNIGGGLRIPHLNGIYIHNNATLGENCTILQQVTIGANEHKIEYGKAPQIGNRVYIGAGAKVIGNIVIGDDVRIGANAVVTKSVPAGKTVVGYNKIIETQSERQGII